MADDWLSGICDYVGPGDDLPVGGYCKIPGWYPERIVDHWVVADPDIDEGVRDKETAELVKGDMIVGVVLNAGTLAAIVATYGRNFFKIQEANGDSLMTLDQWHTRFGTNGLGLVALRNIRRKIDGGGIQF